MLVAYLHELDHSDLAIVLQPHRTDRVGALDDGNHRSSDPRQPFVERQVWSDRQSQLALHVFEIVHRVGPGEDRAPAASLRRRRPDVGRGLCWADVTGARPAMGYWFLRSRKDGRLAADQTLKM